MFIRDLTKPQRRNTGENLKICCFQKDKESVVQGMSLIEQLDEEVYFDGICTLLEEDANHVWEMKKELGCETEQALILEILRIVKIR